MTYLEIDEAILQYFGYAHLPANLQMVSKPFCDLAHAIVKGDNLPESGTVTIGGPLPNNPERYVALRKLLEAKDAAVRAALSMRGQAEEHVLLEAEVQLLRNLHAETSGDVDRLAEWLRSQTSRGSILEEDAYDLWDRLNRERAKA